MINSSIYSARILTAPLIISVLFLNSACGGVSVRALRKDVEKNLPLGSTAPQVIAFLDAKRIHHGALTIVEIDSDYPGERDMRLIHAAIPHVKQRLLFEWGIFMSFRFDEEGRLIDYRINKVGTGP